MDRKILLIAGTIIIVAAVICVVMVFAGGTSITADTPVYENGILKTSVHYDGEQKDVWFQYNIFRQDSLLSSTQVVNSLAVLGTLTKGDSVSELKINLEPGEYKVFIYVLERDEGTKRITGFIRNIVIT